MRKKFSTFFSLLRKDKDLVNVKERQKANNKSILEIDGRIYKVKTEEVGGSRQRSNDENSRELQQMMRDSEALLGLPAHTEDNRPVASPDFGKLTEIEFQTI
jgi:hypothetical protein